MFRSTFFSRRSLRLSIQLLTQLSVFTFVLVAGLFAVAQQDTSSQTAPQSTSSTDSQALPDAPGTAANVPQTIAPEGPTAVFDTSMGRMVCKLYSKESPATVANFVGLAKGTIKNTNPRTHKISKGTPFYDGTIFHRVIPGFMIQGGDPTGTGSGDPGYYINDELNPALNYETPGMLAMANLGPNTNGSQFFITVAAYPSLDGHYTVFGKCDDASVLVAESITEVERDSQDKPLQPVTLDKVTIVENGQPLPPVPSPVAVPATPAQTAPTHSLKKQN